jgi:hypothetical protein
MADTPPESRTAGDDGAEGTGATGKTEEEREGGAIFESGGDEGPIEPGSPTLEGTVFVLLGALIAGGAVVRLWLLFN